MKRFVCSILILTCALCLFSGCSKKIPPRTVRIAIQPSAAFMPLYVARYAGTLEKALAPKKVTVVWQDFESGPPINESLAADLSDIGVIGDVPTVVALAGSTRMKLVGIPASGPNAYAMLGRKDDDSFSSTKDLRGKRVATVFGSTGHNLTKKLLEKEGLSFEDIEFSNIAVSDAEAMLKSFVADAVVIWEPNITRLLDRGFTKIIAKGDETNLRGTNGFIVREEYLTANADIISVILDEYAAAVKELANLSPDITEKLAKALGITPEQIAPIAAKYQYVVSVTQDDIDALQDTISFLVSIQKLSSEYRVEQFVDKIGYER